jgi:glycerol kinase
MPFILALDQGTTSSRAIVFLHEGGIRASSQKEFRQIFPQIGWVEHDPREIWWSRLEVARVALDRAGIKASDLAAIGITNGIIAGLKRFQRIFPSPLSHGWNYE